MASSPSRTSSWQGPRSTTTTGAMGSRPRAAASPSTMSSGRPTASSTRTARKLPE
ncbi:hypothetical protein ABT224_11800 [Streptomyces sp. NPDC001584]|uniref:hypothetical protein n=1 Tax=Streptomyces sp. NPDC001584 TaxID=3154521 RepID=UPI0033192886